MAKKPFYSDAAAVPAKKRVDTAPIGSPRLGSQQNPNVAPKKPGRTNALVQPLKLKVSGHPRSHRVGHR
jgi:hypothetical protein